MNNIEVRVQDSVEQIRAEGEKCVEPTKLVVLRPKQWQTITYNFR